MQYTTLQNGVKMPMIGFGTVNIKGREGVETIKLAIKSGYRLIDTARMYNNEDTVGQAIAQSEVERSELFITSKLCRTSNSYEKAKRDIEDSLKNLQLDYLDLLLVHEPYIESDEIYQAIKEAYLNGKVRAIGISNFNHKCYSEFIKKCEIIPHVNQMESHVYFSQQALQQEMDKYGTKMQAWSPLVSGKKNIFSDDTLKEIGEKYNKTPAQIALRFLIQNGISAIPRTTKLERMRENLAIFDFELSLEDLDNIQKLDEGVSITDWYRADWF
ncbi:MAG: aldo/keto reductase [Turicibacter sp.]|nr:aldo/keto reductase [Turicibacter sp.]